MKIFKNFACILIILPIIFTFSACGFAAQTAQNDTEEPVSKYDRSVLYVRFIDVGQADCILVQCGGETMLIDGGNRGDGTLVAGYLQSLGVDAIDLLVNTHAHEDHLGGLPDVVEAVPVEKALLSTDGYDSSYGEDLIAALEAQNVPYDAAQAGDTFTLGGAQVQVVGPISDEADDLNNTSIVLRLTYNGKSFLFTGDAEGVEENEILAAGYDLQADVLKAGHHGSNASSTYVFLREVMPSFVVISVGAGNSYNLPGSDAMSRFRDTGATIYRTDESGSVLATVDAQGTLSFDFSDTDTDSSAGRDSGEAERTEKSTASETPAAAVPAGEGQIIGNKNSKVYHAPDCGSLPNEENRVYFASAAEAEAAGYRAHSACAGE